MDRIGQSERALNSDYYEVKRPLFSSSQHTNSPKSKCCGCPSIKSVLERFFCCLASQSRQQEDVRNSFRQRVIAPSTSQIGRIHTFSYSTPEDVRKIVSTLHNHFEISESNPESYLANFGKAPHFQVFLEIVRLLQNEDSEKLIQLFDELFKIPVFVKLIQQMVYKQGVTLLHMAAIYRHYEVVKGMLDLGVDQLSKTSGIVFIDQGENENHFIFFVEQGKDYREFISSVYEQQIIFAFQHRSYFQEILYSVSQRKFPLIDQRAIGAIKDVNQLSEGDTLLHLALKNKFDIPVFLVLLEMGANPLIENQEGQTALDKALGDFIPGSAKLEEIIALFLDAAKIFDRENLEKYEKIRNEKISGKTFLYLLIKGSCLSSVSDELDICKNLKNPYNPLAFAFERTDPWKLDESGNSAHTYALDHLDSWNLMNNSRIDQLKTFVLPLFQERIDKKNAAVAELENVLPKDVRGIISAYQVSDSMTKARIAAKEAASHEVMHIGKKVGS